LWLSILNWRRDPDHERKLALIERSIASIEQRTKQIESETEQLREQNARGRQLLSQIDALCFPDASSSIPAPPTAIDPVPSSR
jgi:hypothetical protein